MRKLLKNTDKKFLISLMIIIAMLSTFMAYKIYAQEVTNEMLSEGDGMANGQIGATGYLTVNDLIYRYPIFCCSKGTPLNGVGTTTLVTEQGSSDPEVTGKLKPGSEGMKMFEVSLEGGSTETPFQQGTYTHRTFGEYTVTDVKVATPKEAYILAEMINNLPNTEDGGFHFIGEEDGHKIPFTDEEALENASYMAVNGNVIYIIEDGAGAEQLVMQHEDGNYYYVEESSTEGIGVYSYVQRAWWNTEAGGTGNDVPPNGLSKEADLFEAYIKRIAKSTDPSTFIEQEFEINGYTGTVPAPEIEYAVSYNTDSVTEGGVTYNLDEPTVSWDAVNQEYKIGPFSINYVEEGAAVEGRDAVIFSGITNAELYTDASPEPLVRGEDWNFEWQIGQRDQEDTYEYPHENEIFYISLKYIEGATKITDLKFDFKYMNAGGKYERLEGTYYDVTWVAKEKANWCTSGTKCSHGRINPHDIKDANGNVIGQCSGGSACSHGRYSSHIASTDYWVELESFSSPKTSQLLAGGLIGARWYKDAELHWNGDIPSDDPKTYEGKLKIVKEIYDENGNKITDVDSDKYFTFNVVIGGETETISVKAGGEAYSNTYTWEEDETPPTYEVTEAPENGYEIKEIKNATGTLSTETEVVEVIAENIIISKEGYIEVTKKVTDESLNGRTFDISVKLTGKLKYGEQDIQEYTDSNPLIVSGTVTAGGTWTSEKIKWYEDAPKYEVEEVPGEDYEIKSITPKKGTVAETDPTKVEIINDPIREKGKLKIIKTLQNAEYLSEEYIENLTFEFDIDVQGYGNTPVVLNAKKTDAEYVWEYETDYYTWIKGQNPEYTITEKNVPEGTEFDSANSPDTEVIITGTSVTGKLVSDETKDFTVINNFINKAIPKQGTLEIEKIVNVDSLVNNEYEFTTTITGSFEYKGVYYKDTTIYLTNDSAVEQTSVDLTNNNAPYVVIYVGETKTGTWLSDVFTWYGKAPEYKVEEQMSGLAGVQSTINPSEGKLDETTTVKVIAENRSQESKKGALSIIKTLENADKFTDEYIKSLKFKFHIVVGSVDYGTVELEPEKVNNTYVWQDEWEYTWDAESPNPTYTITEVELPEGTEFVSANSPNGNATISGTTITGTLIPDSEPEFKVINNFINKLITTEDTSGYLKIKKIVSDESLVGKTFTFTAIIGGEGDTFEYNGVEYKDEALTIPNISITGALESANGGNVWTSGKIIWYGTNAPKYEVIENPSEYAELYEKHNTTGVLVAGGESEAQIAIFKNKAIEKRGTLTITKKLEDGGTSNDTFIFDVMINGVQQNPIELKAGETSEPIVVTWDASEPTPEYVVQERPSETAEHKYMTNGEDTTTTGEISGYLINNDNVEVICVNKLEKNQGKVVAKKEVTMDEKMNAEALDENTIFGIEIKIIASENSTFEIDNEVLEVKTFRKEIRAGESFETPIITWYGDNAPTYQVTEYSMPQGWKLDYISNQSGEVSSNLNAPKTAIVYNVLASRVEIELTMEMAGHVWEDIRVENKEEEQTETYGTQGIFDENLEVGIDGVEVYIYKVLYSGGTEVGRSLGTAYEENSNTQIEYPIYTENGGYWSSPRMAVPALTEEEKNAGYTAGYDVEFVYDGQTYEPTDFLVTSNGDAQSYINASTAERDNWAKNSMALDTNREEVDNRIAQVAGETPIDGQGNTTGKAISSSGETNSIYYESVDYSEGLEATRKISEVQTKNDSGKIYDLYKAKASTSKGGLIYPFDERSHLESIDTYIDDFGVVERYKYSATYNYTLNINLGLLKREEADLGTTKDLHSAKVVVNEKLLNYKFNTLADLTGSTISRQLKADDMDIEYELGLYETDYYYRAEIYGTDAEVYDAKNTFYKSLGKSLEDTELDVYLTYKIRVYNESPSYIVGINSVTDYFDSSFGTPINAVETKYVQTIDGVAVDTVTEVANKSYVETSSGNKFDVNWEVTERNIEGSDGITYNKMVANFGSEELRLASGENAEFTVTFKVQKENVDGVKDAVILGQKANIAEISNYSTYYEDGRIAGKIDKDSAPDNVNIEQYNDRTWYEDDTDSAPILNLTLTEEVREIEGLAWEDKEETEVLYGSGQVVGNGVYDEGEAVIGGLTTELVEKVVVKNVGSENEYTEYDFLWPTSEPLNALGGKSLKSLTGFDSTIETSRTQVPEGEEGLGIGEYKFEGVPAGNYVVRFLYGNDKTELEDSVGITGNPVALKLDDSGNVVNYSGSEDILIANYDNDSLGATPAIYNGQDFKTTTYQSGVANTDNDGYLNNEWHDLTLDNGRLSDARDDESRRLQTIANSHVITNVNGEVLVTANDKTANHTDLYKDYSMFADTAKIKVNIEDLVNNEIVDSESLPNGIEVKSVKGTVLKDGIAETNTVTYTIKDIDVGIEQRSETAIVLDKQISSIKLITSDNNTIFNAIYDISYEEISAAEYGLGQFTKIAERDGKYIVAKVELNSASVGTDVLQAINKVEDKDIKSGTQNFRYINVDTEILQGTTIEINYKFTALNVSEVDRADSKLENIDQTALANNTTVVEELLKAAEVVSKENATLTKTAGQLQYNDSKKIGSYLGTTYYQGANANGNDSVVTTTVRQLVDYVDNDAVFAASYNNTTDHSWRNATVNEVFGNGYEADRLLSKDIVRENNIFDKNKVAYITDQKNNIIVSVDNKSNDATLTNGGFETKLLPYEADDTKYTSSMELTITRTIAAESDADSLVFDNLAEIVKIENSVGRRDITVLPGNANPKDGEFETSIEERDSSATELITLTPPTGIKANVELTLQILLVSGIALVILAIGVVIIKKKVLTK